MTIGEGLDWVRDNLSPRDISKIFLLNRTLTFFDSQDLVHAHVGNLVNHATWPAHFYQIDLCPFLQTKVELEIAVRKIAGTATYLIHLPQISGYQGYACAYAVTI